MGLNIAIETTVLRLVTIVTHNCPSALYFEAGTWSIFQIMLTGSGVPCTFDQIAFWLSACGIQYCTVHPLFFIPQLEIS